MNLIMISSNHWNSQCFLKRIDISWCHNYHSQFWLCSFVVKAILPLPVVLDIYCRALLLQTEHIHIQTIVNQQIMIDHYPKKFKNQWLDPPKTFNGDGPMVSKPLKNNQSIVASKNWISLHIFLQIWACIWPKPQMIIFSQKSSIYFPKKVSVSQMM